MVLHIDRVGTSEWCLDFFPIQADEQGRVVWLVTSDAVGFYEAVGYTMFREQWIGTRNPAWSGPPVPVRLVSLSMQLLTLPDENILLCHSRW